MHFTILFTFTLATIFSLLPLSLALPYPDTTSVTTTSIDISINSFDARYSEFGFDWTVICHDDSAAAYQSGKSPNFVSAKECFRRFQSYCAGEGEMKNQAVYQDAIGNRDQFCTLSQSSTGDVEDGFQPALADLVYHFNDRYLGEGAFQSGTTLFVDRSIENSEKASAEIAAKSLVSKNHIDTIPEDDERSRTSLTHYINIVKSIFPQDIIDLSAPLNPYDKRSLDEPKANTKALIPAPISKRESPSLQPRYGKIMTSDYKLYCPPVPRGTGRYTNNVNADQCFERFRTYCDAEGEMKNQCVSRNPDGTVANICNNVVCRCDKDPDAVLPGFSDPSPEEIAWHSNMNGAEYGGWMGFSESGKKRDGVEE